jgi:uncharacterized protein
MKKTAASFELSASDLVGYLSCRHLSALDRAVAEGTLTMPKSWDPMLQTLRDRGAAHENAYVEQLANAGLETVRIEGVDVTDQALAQTLAAMGDGIPVIVQGSFAYDGWVGRVDILRRVETPSALGAWSYEALDTKLARETRAEAILQLCLYSDLLAHAQGRAPENMYVVAPWSDFTPREYRFADYAAYFRKVKQGLLASLTRDTVLSTYPDPVEHCDICRWREACDKRRRDDDHPCLVAGISKLQIGELARHGVTTMKALSAMPLPLQWKPDRGAVETYERMREQARIQVEARETGALRHELLPVVKDFGLTRLPAPSDGDVFFDVESDPFVDEHGLEYLFGYWFKDSDGRNAYHADWAFSRAKEKAAFESSIDFVMARWAQFPDLHIYHYAPYEPAALKRLMGRYATREDELDRMLRARLFVDLYQVVRQGLRASVESYSIKQMEPFYGFARSTPLPEANAALAVIQANLELGESSEIPQAAREVVASYNRDDCAAAAGLRNWLEALRAQAIEDGADAPRPVPGDGAPTEDISDWLARVNALVEGLTHDVPVDPADRTEEQHGRWILANLLDWHRREEKAVWWEYFRLADLSADDLMEERAGLSGLTFMTVIGGTAKAPIHRYGFPPQETEIRGGEDLRYVGGERLGRVEAISFETNTADIKKRKDTATLHPDAVFAHMHVKTKVMAESLMRLGETVALYGLTGDGEYQAARDLLLRAPPRTGDVPLYLPSETTVEAAVRLCGHLDGGILAIQGPPGAGKTYTGARMICELVRQGKTVGITANSHKVIRNLIDETIQAADYRGLDLQCCQKAGAPEPPGHRLSFAESNDELAAALGNTAQVGGATAWFWSRPDAAGSVDVLFADEAAQMSLANVLAVSQAARTVVLIGDPQQLDQPMQGSHPEGADVSALDYILAGDQTIAADRGLFLEETWRLHPDICAFTSELFYEGKLSSKDGLERQAIEGRPPVTGSGLIYLPVVHEGNQNASVEEAEAVAAIVASILENNTRWINRYGEVQSVALDGIVIITPYNAQVSEIQKRLPAARIGTVDKFQGQEAPIAVYSTATSSRADAPRGMEFLYSLNRLNVATSRARCISILIGSPMLFETMCQTPRQMQLANAFCRYLELAMVP